jgi:hypothetical protein
MHSDIFTTLPREYIILLVVKLAGVFLTVRRTALEYCKTYATCPPHLLPEKRAAPGPLKCPVPGVSAPNIEGTERFSGRPRGTEWGERRKLQRRVPHVQVTKKIL